MLQPLTQVIFFGDGLVSPGVAQRQEKMIIGGHIVWAVFWMDENFLSQLRQFVMGGVCVVGSGVIVKEVDGTRFAPLP